VTSPAPRGRPDIADTLAPEHLQVLAALLERIAVTVRAGADPTVLATALGQTAPPHPPGSSLTGYDSLDAATSS
jgi:hypothetical protein